MYTYNDLQNMKTNIQKAQNTPLYHQLAREAEREIELQLQKRELQRRQQQMKIQRELLELRQKQNAPKLSQLKPLPHRIGGTNDKYTSTKTKVKIFIKNKLFSKTIYTNSRKHKYIKVNNKFVLLSKFI